MNSAFLGSGCVYLGCPLVGFIGHAEKFFSNAVRKASKGAGYCLCLFTAYRKVDDIVVNSVIADKSACVGKFCHLLRKTERFNLCRQITAFCFRGVHHALDTNSQHCAGSSRGKVDDVLRFFEGFFCIIWHTHRRSNTASGGIDKFFISPQGEFSAICAPHNAVVVRAHEVEKIYQLEIYKPISK